MVTGGSALLEARGLTRLYGLGGIRDLSLTAHAGEVVGIAGPNGAGKTTALRLLSARLRPTDGELRIGGVDALRHSGHARAHVGFLSHRPPLYETMRVRDYLRHCARVFGIPRAASQRAAERVIEETELAGVAARIIRNLSQGFRQRVGLAQALVHDPPVLVLDEPTAGLDARAAAAFIERLGPLSPGRAILLTSHVFPEIDATCDRLVVINRGLAASSTPLYGATAGEDALSVRIVDARGATPDPETLGLDTVQPLGDGRFLIPHADAATRQRLMATLLERGWRLEEWLPPAGMAERCYRAVIERG